MTTRMLGAVPLAIVGGMGLGIAIHSSGARGWLLAPLLLAALVVGMAQQTLP